MKGKTLLRLWREGRMPALIRLTRLSGPFYRACFVAAAARHGVLALLADRERTFDEIAHALGVKADGHETLAAWLRFGVRLGELTQHDGRFALSGSLARSLADPANGSANAALQEIIRFHSAAILDAPAMARTGERLTLDDQDGELIAESTRVIEPFVAEAIDRALERAVPTRVLEVGCGSGIYIRELLGRAPSAEITGLELQDDVAEKARANLARWGLGDRVQVRVGDVRDEPPGGGYDLVTLHNNIYYFAVGDRVQLLERVRRLLAPGGRLLLTTSCLGGNMGLEALSLWFASSSVGGRLPESEELVAQMGAAGFEAVEALSLIPGDKFFCFLARRPQSDVEGTHTEEPK